MTILQKFRTSPNHIACVYMCSELMTMTILQSVEGLEGKSMGRVAQKIMKCTKSYQLCHGFVCEDNDVPRSVEFLKDVMLTES